MKKIADLRAAGSTHPAPAEESTSAEEVCRKAGISEANCYCRKKYGGLIPPKMERLEQHYGKNRRRRVIRRKI